MSALSVNRNPHEKNYYIESIIIVFTVPLAHIVSLQPFLLNVYCI